MPTKIYAEIPFFLLFFSFILSGSIKSNLLIYRTCYVTLDFNKTDCALLGSENTNNHTAELEKHVQPYASMIGMVQTIIEGIFTSIICLFVGPWSDKYGRKPVLIIPVIGYTISFILYALFSYLETASPWFFLFASIPLCLTGGTASYLTVFLCYITEISSERNRGIRMGIFEGIITLGMLIGHLSSSYIFSATNYPTVFLIAASSTSLSLILTIFFIRESLITVYEDIGLSDKFKNFFKISHIKEMAKTTFRKRENYDRFVFLGLLLITTLSLIATNGDGSVQTLYLREKFLWSLRQCTFLSAASSFNWVIGAVIGIYVLHTRCKIPETIMIVIGFVSMVLGSLFFGLAQYDWEVYGASFTRAMGGVVNPMARSLVSKIIPFEEVGKIFSLIIVFESLISTTGSPMYTAIYNSTIKTNSAIYNFVTAGVYAIDLTLAVSLILVPRRIRYEVFDNESTIGESHA